jgi:hypothetical protein
MITQDIEVVAGSPISVVFPVPDNFRIHNTRVSSQLRTKQRGGSLLFDFAPYIRFLGDNQMNLYVPGSQTTGICKSGYFDVLVEGQRVASGRVFARATVSDPSQSIFVTPSMAPVVSVDYDTYKYVSFQVCAPVPDCVRDDVKFGYLPEATIYVPDCPVVLNVRNGIEIKVDECGKRWVVGHPFIPLSVPPGEYPYVLTMDMDDGSRTAIHAGMIRVREIGMPNL